MGGANPRVLARRSDHRQVAGKAFDLGSLSNSCTEKFGLLRWVELIQGPGLRERPASGGEMFSDLRLLSNRCREAWGLVIEIVRGGCWRGSQLQAQTMYKAFCCTRDEWQFINYGHHPESNKNA